MVSVILNYGKSEKGLAWEGFQTFVPTGTPKSSLFWNNPIFTIDPQQLGSSSSYTVLRYPSTHTHTHPHPHTPTPTPTHTHTHTQSHTLLRKFQKMNHFFGDISILSQIFLLCHFIALGPLFRTSSIFTTIYHICSTF